MRNIILLLSAAILSTGVAACKTKQVTTASGSAASASSAPEAANTGANAAQVYRVVVSFTSKGAGTSAEKREAFIRYVESHPKKPAYTMIRWGREGETDYCLTLSELSKKEQLKFIEDLKKAMAGSDQVIITENTAAPHARR